MTGFFDQSQLDELAANDLTLSAVVSQCAKLAAMPGGAVADYNVPGWYQDPAGFVRAVAPLTRDAGLAYCSALAARLNGGSSSAPSIVANWATVNKSVSGHDGALSMAELGVSFVLADALGGRPATPELARWLRGVYLPTVDSIKGIPWNWGDWGTWGALAARYHLGDSISSDADHLAQQIAVQIRPDGSMPAEIARGESGLWYTYFALAPTTAAAHLVANALGVSLWAQLAPALDYLFAWLKNPGQGIAVPGPNDPWPADLFAACAKYLPRPEWSAYAAKKRPIVYCSHHIAWVSPELAP